MSRKLKFRTWDYTDKKMYDGVDIEEMRLRDLESPEDVEFMQFTGLLDKSGVEIYEGDIVAFSEKKDGCRIIAKGDTAIVRHDSYYWGEDGRSFVAYHNDESDGDDFLDWKKNYYEVIGNIHENPELLESE